MSPRRRLTCVTGSGSYDRACPFYLAGVIEQGIRNLERPAVGTHRPPSAAARARITVSNPAAALLFNLSEEKLLGQSVSSLVGGFDFNHWLEEAQPQPAAERVVIQGQDFLLDITPVQLAGGRWPDRHRRRGGDVEIGVAHGPAILTLYPWPGNVRQLKNALYRAMAQREGPALSAGDIDLPDFGQALPLTDDVLDGSLDDISKRFERSVLTRLYRAYPSTRNLAKRLGVSHTAIANKLREYGLNGKKTDEDTFAPPNRQGSGAAW